MQPCGIVFDIQRFAIHDGPGIRTTVFLSGCSNRCAWCHNPESLSSGPQLQYFPLRCIECGACARACPTGAHGVDENGHAFDRTSCMLCGQCAGVCNVQALLMRGAQTSVGDVMRQVAEDRAYYAQSGGGMTVSGGEPVLQNEFCAALLAGARADGIHTALETAGNYPAVMLDPLLPHLDLVLFDIKGISPSVYENHVHGDSAAIFASLDRLDASGVPIIARTPVVGGVNDTIDEIAQIAERVSRLSHLRHYQLIPYHTLGKAKYDALGKPYNPPYYTPDKQRMDEFERAAARYVPVFNQERGLLVFDKQ